MEGPRWQWYRVGILKQTNIGNEIYGSLWYLTLQITLDLTLHLHDLYHASPKSNMSTLKINGCFRCVSY